MIAGVLRQRTPVGSAMRARAILIDCKSVVVADASMTAARHAHRFIRLSAFPPARRDAAPPSAATAARAARVAAAADAGRHPVHARRRLHDHDAARAAIHAALRDRSAAVRVHGVGVHVRRGGKRLRRRVLDRSLRPAARAALALRRVHRRDRALRARARLLAAARGADRRRHLRRRARRPHVRDRRRPRSVCAPGDGDGRRRGRVLAGGGRRACRLSLWIAAHFSWRAPFLALAAFSVVVALAAHARVDSAADAHVARGRAPPPGGAAAGDLRRAQSPAGLRLHDRADVLGVHGRPVHRRL